MPRTQHVVGRKQFSWGVCQEIAAHLRMHWQPEWHWKAGNIISVEDKSVGQLAIIETALIFQTLLVLGCTPHT